MTETRPSLTPRMIVWSLGVMALLLIGPTLATVFSTGGGIATSGPLPLAPPIAAQLAPPAASGPYYAVFSAPALVGVPGVSYTFQVDGTPYSAAGGASINVTNLSAGPHEIGGIGASPALPGWAYFGSASTGSVLVEPGTTAVLLTYADVNRTLPNITLSFQAPQLGLGTPWGLVFNGTYRSTTNAQISLSLPPGDYVRAYEWALGLQGNVEYRTNVAPSYLLYDASAIITVNYTAYFQLGVYAGPGGSVSPTGLNWELYNTTVRLYAVGSSVDLFKTWTGVGVGNYSGESPQVNITLGGPVTEYAVFLPRPNNTGIVRFLEKGLPNGTIWTVFLGSIGYSSGTALLAISGLIPCTNTTLVAGQPGVYAALFPDAYQNVTTPGLSARYVAVAPPPLVCGQSERITLNYTTQYLVLDHWSAGGAVTTAVNGSLVVSGYFNPGTVVTFQAIPTFGYSFGGWSGVGVGAYSGGLSQVSVGLVGPIDEIASFTAGPLVLAVGYPVTFQVGAGQVVSIVWTVSLDGQTYAANGSRLTVPDVTAGNHSVVVADEWGPDGGSRSVPSQPSFTLPVNGPTSVNLSFTVSYWLTVVVVGPGNVTPGTGWVAAGASVQLRATADGGASLLGWASAQSGGFNGNNSSMATVVPIGPIVETATFGANPPPPDFWHRSPTLAAAAVAGLVVGFVVLAVVMRRLRPPQTTPAPPAGAVREWRGVVLRRSGPRPSSGPPPRRPIAPAVWLFTLVALSMVGSIPVGNWTGTTHSIAPSLIPAATIAGHTPRDAGAASVHVAQGAGAAVERGASGSNVTFQEAGLPASVTWTVSTWPFDASVAAPSTWSGSGSNLTVPIAAGETAVDYAVWTIPLNATTVWLGTANVSGPFNPLTTATVGVTFAPATIAGLPFRFHVVETGLPTGVVWHTSIVGVGYDVVTASADWTIAGGKSFVFTAPTVVVSPGLEYVALRFDVEGFGNGAGWSNSTVNPVVRLATSDFWVDVNFTPEFRVHVLGDTGGVVSPPSGWYPGGQPITITASPIAGYHFVNWTGTGLGAVNATTAAIEVVPGSAIFEVASFASATFAVTVQESGVPAGDTYSIVFAGTIYSFDTSIATFNQSTVEDATLSVPFSPSTLVTGERFVPLNVTTSYASATNGTFYVDGNGTVTVRFAVQYALTITASGAGTTAPAPGSYWETAATGVAIRAFPSNGTLALESWRGTGSGAYSGNDSGIVVTMNGPIDEAAQFGLPLPPQGSLLTVTETGLPAGVVWSAAAGAAGGAGATSSLLVGPLASGPTTVVVPNVLIGPGERYVAAGGGAFRFALSGNQTFAVAFVQQWLVNVTVLFGGTVGDFPSWVPENASVTLLAEPPSAGYQFNGWSGASNSTAALITLNANAPLSLTANFGAVPAPVNTGPKDAPIAAADVGIPAVVGAIVAFFWFRGRRAP